MRQGFRNTDACQEHSIEALALALAAVGQVAEQPAVKAEG
jgi:hypothetical protein